MTRIRTPMETLVDSVVKPIPQPPLDRETKALLKIQAVAKTWWRGKRPIGWTKSQHLANPTVNCTGKHELSLAAAVAKWVLLGG